MYELYNSYNLSSSKCEFCGKKGPTKVYLGVSFCADCYKAITENNDDYFKSIGFRDTTKGAAALVNSMNGHLERDPLEERITTTNGFFNTEIKEYYGTVSGVAFYLAGGIIGEGIMLSSDLFRKAFSSAKKSMYEEAELYGANAIIGMTCSLTNVTNGNMFVVVTGTAVKIKTEETSKE